MEEGLFWSGLHRRKLLMICERRPQNISTEINPKINHEKLRFGFNKGYVILIEIYLFKLN